MAVQDGIWNGQLEGGQGAKQAKMGMTVGIGGQEKGRLSMGAGGGAAKDTGRGFPGKTAGQKGGNSYPY